MDGRHPQLLSQNRAQLHIIQMKEFNKISPQAATIRLLPGENLI